MVRNGKTNLQAKKVYWILVVRIIDHGEIYTPFSGRILLVSHNYNTLIPSVYFSFNLETK